ncbi:Structural maintenance of chromosomes protein like [Quillaja saponaria]|uniref:Structural maintenance of chromosomes protein like n=1 Tax=Quillaja saponaria TaxID=32244 RepID=A0AAD7LAK4_QUISA|nr:Structural maintenance of chromosomes protein like [Quillaja saponaria]
MASEVTNVMEHVGRQKENDPNSGKERKCKSNFRDVLTFFESRFAKLELVVADGKDRFEKIDQCIENLASVDEEVQGEMQCAFNFVSDIWRIMLDALKEMVLAKFAAMMEKIKEIKANWSLFGIRAKGYKGDVTIMASEVTNVMEHVGRQKENDPNGGKERKGKSNFKDVLTSFESRLAKVELTVVDGNDRFEEIDQHIENLASVDEEVQGEMQDALNSLSDSWKIALDALKEMVLAKFAAMKDEIKEIKADWSLFLQELVAFEGIMKELSRLCSRRISELLTLT